MRDKPIAVVDQNKLGRIHGELVETLHLGFKFLNRNKLINNILV